MPACIVYISFEEEGYGAHAFTLELAPLALQDVIGLDFLAGLCWPVDGEFYIGNYTGHRSPPILADFPRKIVVSKTFTDDDDDVGIFTVSSRKLTNL